MKRLVYFLVASITLFVACQSDRTKPLTVATAANMQYAMRALIKAFTAESGIDCQVVVSSSGKLTAQIQEGAPYDIFFSADLKYPTTLAQKGLTTSIPEVYAYGELVLWSTVKNLNPTLALLSSNRVRHVALANPQIAPYGRAAAEILQANGIYDQLTDKLVFGESVAQTNQFVLSQAAEVGFVPKSAILSPQLRSEGQWTALDTQSYTRIIQGMVILKSSADKQAKAEQFRSFLFSATGKQILRDFGYLVPEK